MIPTRIEGTLKELCEHGLAETDPAHIEDASNAELLETAEYLDQLCDGITHVIGGIFPLAKEHERSRLSDLLITATRGADADTTQKFIDLYDSSNGHDVKTLRAIGERRVKITALFNAVRLIEESREMPCVDELLEAPRRLEFTESHQQGSVMRRLDRTTTIL